MKKYFQYHKNREPKETYSARVICDSITKNKKIRLTTLEVTFPRMVLAEYNTHRMFSRNSASSRAIPVHKRIEAIKRSPFIPEKFGKNKKGMSSTENVENQDEARKIWMDSCYQAIEHAQKLKDIKVHKQFANRILEPYAWHTVVCTATEWDNFFALRIDADAQPEIQIPAKLMKQALEDSIPEKKMSGEWHLPFIFEEDKDFNVEDKIKLSIARSARVSYLTHDGKRDPQADFNLYDRLVTAGHMSPTEHVAIVGTWDNVFQSWMAPTIKQSGYYKSPFIGNFMAPWIQYRKTISGESCFRKANK